MPKISGKSPATFMLAERGVAHLLLMLVLLAGLVFAVYLVQQKTNIFSRASSGPISGPVGGVLASVNVSPSSAAAGSVVTVSWSGISRPAVKDWISINEKPSNKRVHWFFLNSCNQRSTNTPLASGNCQVTLPYPLLPAEHEIRMLADNSNDVVLAKTNINITAPSLGVTGTTVSVAPSTVAPGGYLTVAWSNISSPTVKDWIALYKQGDQDRRYRNWIFIGSCSRTVGSAPALSGSCSLQIPANTTNGTYEIRLFANNGYGRLAVSSPFTVSASSSGGVYTTPSIPTTGVVATPTPVSGNYSYPTPSSYLTPSGGVYATPSYPSPSTSIGNGVLEVRARDRSELPSNPLYNGKVRVKDPVSGTVISSGLTSASGYLQLTGLPTNRILEVVLLQPDDFRTQYCGSKQSINIAAGGRVTVDMVLGGIYSSGSTCPRS